MSDIFQTQTKDAFDWYSGLEDLFIEKLLEECADYKKKAKEYRKGKKITVDPGFTSLVNNFTNAGIIDNVNVSEISNEVIASLKSPEIEPIVNEMPTANSATPVPTTVIPTGEIQIVGSNGQKLTFTCGGQEYTFNFILKKDDPDARWLNILSKNDEYIIEWNIRHPFFKPYIDDPKFLELMQQFTFALALSEIESKKTSVDGKIAPSIIRTKMNDTLKAVIKE